MCSVENRCPDVTCTWALIFKIILSLTSGRGPRCDSFSSPLVILMDICLSGSDLFNGFAMSEWLVVPLVFFSASSLLCEPDIWIRLRPSLLPVRVLPYSPSASFRVLPNSA